MTDNVRCAGGGQWYETWEDAEIGAERNVACGWTAFWVLQDEGIDQFLTCPECDGRVEFIPVGKP